MPSQVVFYSGKIGEEMYAEIIERRKYTVKLLLPDGNKIVKKNKQVQFLD